jgi:hypothetical protein
VKVAGRALSEFGRGDDRGVTTETTMKQELNELRAAQTFLWAFLALVLSACATYQPGALDPAAYLARARSETEGGVTVTTAALSADEAEAVFGVELDDDDIQPVWIEIENREDAAYWYMHRYTDPMYFSPAEAAFANREWFADETNRRMEQVFLQRGLQGYVPPHSTVVGFVYTRRDPDTKVVSVNLLGDDQMKVFDLVVFTPDLAADHRRIDLAALYRPDQMRRSTRQGCARHSNSCPVVRPMPMVRDRAIL